MSALPDFLLRYRHYLLRVIEVVLALRFEAGQAGRRSWQDWPGRVPSGADDAALVQFVWRAGGALADGGAGMLAQQDSPSAWLDAHGEALRANSPGRAACGERICWPGARHSGEKWQTMAG